MAANLNYNIFPLIAETENNETARPNGLVLEYFQANVTTSSDAGDVEVPTVLGEVLGVISLCYDSEFGSGDSLANISTDGVITTGAVTVRVTGASGWTDGTHIIRGFFVGRKSETVLSLG